MGVTDDRSDPRLTHGVDDEAVPMAEVYLVLSDEERAKGFVRPVRRTYVHVGSPGPQFPIFDLTAEQRELVGDSFAKWEPYPESELPKTGKFWTEKQLDEVGKGCGTSTTMGKELAETYARDPKFYGATFCVHCSMHRPVGADGEFVWDDGTRVGT